MPKFPEPPSPAVLRQVGPEVQVLPAGTRLWRVYFQGGAHPTTWEAFRAFGPCDARFDHHLPPRRMQGRGILYAALAGKTCIAEVYQATRLVDRGEASPALVAFETARDLKLLDLTGSWPTRAGASMALCTGPRVRARRWSQAIYQAFPEVDGLLSASSMHANRPSVALYERAAESVPRRPVFHRRLDDPVLLTVLRNAAADLGYGLL